MSAEVKKMESKEKEEEIKDNTVKEKQAIDDLEVMKNKDVPIEEVKENEPKQGLAKKIRQQWQLILKILELVLCALCFAFFYQPANQSANIAKHNLEQVALIFLAFVGYMLINIVFIVAKFIKDKIPFRISAIFSAVAAILFFVSAILLIVDRKNKFQGMYYEPHVYLASMLSAATVFAFVNAIFFAVDAIYTLMLKEDF